MLTPFPALLSLTFFAPTLLRLAAAIVLFYLASYHYRKRDDIARVSFPLVGAGMWIPWLLLVVEGVVAIGFFVGYYTQYAAILGMALAIKHFLCSKRHHSVFPLSRLTMFLLFFICLSLLITGAGAFAVDIPL